MINESRPHIISVNECISDIIKYVDVMIYYTAMYEDLGSTYGIVRRFKTYRTGDWMDSRTDIRNINNAAVKCIEIIDKHK